jgi:hypothetical protein
MQGAELDRLTCFLQIIQLAQLVMVEVAQRAQQIAKQVQMALHYREVAQAEAQTMPQLKAEMVEAV